MSLVEQTPLSDEGLVGFGSDRVATERAEYAPGRKDKHPPCRTSGTSVSADADVEREEQDDSGQGVSALTMSTAAIAAAAAADNSLDSFNDNYEEEEECGADDDEAQLHATLLPRSVRLGLDGDKGLSDSKDGSKKGARVTEAEETGQGGVLMAVRIMVSTDQSASFFTAVGLSGMGAGVIDTFLFIR